MKRTPLLITAAGLCLTAHCVFAQSRTSASYSVSPDTLDGGGQRTASALYTASASIGGIAGVSSVAAPAETAKHGYLGQLYEVTGLVLNSPASSVNELATLQLSAWQLLDDATFLGVNPASVNWSVLGGPIDGISASGLATAGTVFQNTGASVQGSFGGFTGTLNLTVLDSIPDNSGSYAGDGLGDDWQVQYFGLDNPLAAPGFDPDGDGQTNIFEFTAGLDPTDSNSRFKLRIERGPLPPNRREIVFTPLNGRNYTVEFRNSLTAGNWTPLTNFSIADNGSERTVTDLDATGSTKFYRAKIDKP